MKCAQCSLRIVDFVILMLIGTLLCYIFLSFFGDVWASPKLTISEKHLDFGVVSAGVLTTKSIHFHNSGGQKLQIQKVQTGCGCTEIKVRNNVLGAGQQGTIDVSLTGNLQPGNNSVDIYVFSNDRKTPVQHILVQYSSISDQYFEPSQLDFGIICQDALPAIRAVSMIEPKSKLFDPSIDNLAVSTSSAFLEGKVKLRENRTRSVEVTLKTDSPIGEFYEQVMIHDSKRDRQYYVNTVGTVRGSIFASPKVLDCGSIYQTSNQFVETIVLRARNNGEHYSICEIQLSESIKPFLSYEIDSVDKSKLRITFSPQSYDKAWATAEIRGNIVLICDTVGHEQMISVNVPVRFQMKVGRVGIPTHLIRIPKK